MGTASRYIFVSPWFRHDDVIAPHRMSALMIRDIEIESTHRNLLAMVFFVVRHADADARARCTFIPFPNPNEERPHTAREGR